MHLLGSERPWQRRLLEFVLLLVLAFVFEMALTLVLAPPFRGTAPSRDGRLRAACPVRGGAPGRARLARDPRARPPGALGVGGAVIGDRVAGVRAGVGVEDVVGGRGRR